MIGVASLYKLSFFFGALAPIFCMFSKPVELRKKINLSNLLVVVIPYLLPLVYYLLLKTSGEDFTSVGRIHLFDIFTFGYWSRNLNIIRSYTVTENFGLPVVLLALVGIAVAFIKRQGLLNRFIIGWSLTLIPYAMLFSDFINQHNYYQMPFLALVCVSCAYGLKVIIPKLNKITGRDLTAVTIAGFILFSLPSLAGGSIRIYRTVFLGADIAGKSIKEFTKEQERFFILTHFQGYAVARYAERFCGWPENLEELRRLEEHFGIRYIVIFPAAFLSRLKQDNAMFGYVNQHYFLKETGFVEGREPQGYLILERSKGAVSLEESLRTFNSTLIKTEKYELFGKKIPFFVFRDSY